MRCVVVVDWTCPPRSSTRGRECKCRGGRAAQLRRPTFQRTTRPGTSRKPTATTASTGRVDRERTSTW